MAVPRPVLLALVGLALLASVILVTRSGSQDSVNSTSSPAKPVVTPSAPAPKPKKAEARKAGSGKDAKRSPAKPAKREKAPASRAASGGVAPAGSTVQQRVLAAARALGEDKVVIFFFTNPGAADDVGARVAMKPLRKLPGVQIFDASLDEVAAYRPMLSSVGISQIPSTVIVRPGRKAILIQGFVDSGTLLQNVADALR